MTFVPPIMMPIMYPSAAHV